MSAKDETVSDLHARLDALAAKLRERGDLGDEERALRLEYFKRDVDDVRRHRRTIEATQAEVARVVRELLDGQRPTESKEESKP